MRRFATVRARTTAAATVLFALALAVGGFGLVTVLRSSMVDNVDTALRLRATDIGALLRGGASFDEVAIVDEEDSFVQILADGEVVAASSNIDGEEPIAVGGIGQLRTLASHPVDDSDFRVLVGEVDTPDGPVIVVLGSTLENVDDTVATTITTLALGTPALVALAAAMTWVLVGRALRPVEAIRSEVAEIGATDLHRRVPRPATDDEIGRLAGTMNDMLDRIESGTARQQRFVSDASHELRTPLAISRHMLETALRDPSSTDWPTVAAGVLDEELRMQRLVDDLLWLAKHDQRPGPDRHSLVDLDEIVLGQAHRQPERDGVELDLSAVSAGQVRGNADDLTRVVQNLLDNALRHASGRVVVSLRSGDGGRVGLHVDDDGAGVEPELREAIFERFARADTARTRDHGGAGLGLAIAREIIDDHHGTLTVSAGPLGGARFTVELGDARTDRPSRPR